jgi:serine/threonine-protein kinase HipA
VKLQPGTPLRVSFEFAPDRIVPVGRVALDRGTAVLEYGPEFLASRLGINPLFPPPGTELVRAAEPRTFGGLHGVLADSSSLDYGELLKAVRIVTRHQGEVEKMFRRMVFNVLAHNRDDHTKQHAFLMDGTGRWTLAPAYDLTFSQGPGGEHYLTVAGNGTDVTRTALDAVGKREGIDAAAVREVTDQVVEAVSRFTSFARDYGVSARTTSEIGRALDRALKAFTG